MSSRAYISHRRNHVIVGVQSCHGPPRTIRTRNRGRNRRCGSRASSANPRTHQGSSFVLRAKRTSRVLGASIGYYPANPPGRRSRKVASDSLRRNGSGSMANPLAQPHAGRVAKLTSRRGVAGEPPGGRGSLNRGRRLTRRSEDENRISRSSSCKSGN